MKQFQESLNTAVFTTAQIVSKKSPILFVFHDDDGSWQFHGPEESLKDEDIRLISLKEIINIDKSLLEIADLPIGFEAFRKSKNSKWTIRKSDPFDDKG